MLKYLYFVCKRTKNLLNECTDKISSTYAVDWDPIRQSIVSLAQEKLKQSGVLELSHHIERPYISATEQECLNRILQEKKISLAREAGQDYIKKCSETKKIMIDGLGAAITYHEEQRFIELTKPEVLTLPLELKKLIKEYEDGDTYTSPMARDPILTVIGEYVIGDDLYIIKQGGEIVNVITSFEES